MLALMKLYDVKTTLPSVCNFRLRRERRFHDLVFFVFLNYVEKVVFSKRFYLANFLFVKKKEVIFFSGPV